MSKINTTANLSTAQNRFGINWTVVYGPRDILNVMSKRRKSSTVNDYVFQANSNDHNLTTEKTIQTMHYCLRGSYTF